MKSNFSYSNTPLIRRKRSVFDLSHSVKTSANVGTLYPFDVQEIYPGDTLKTKTAVVSRLTSSFISPVMDNLFLDVYYFFVPSRILYDKFKNVFGENTDSAWANTVEYEVPVVSGPVSRGTIADYMGLPLKQIRGGSGFNGVSALPFRAFAKIYDDWFRDENNISPMHIQTGGSSGAEALNSDSWSPSNYTGLPPKVAKLHDYFTSCLPAPQKGDSVPLGTSVIGSDVPVYSSATERNFYSDAPLQFGLLGSNNPAGIYKSLAVGSGTDSRFLNTVAVDGPSVTNLGSNPTIYPINLYAKTGGIDVTSATVNDLRLAFQYQRMLERDARSGSRYVEYLASAFGVSGGDYRLQRSEFLGGRRSPISITQVTQTAGFNSDSSPLGTVAAYSHSGGKSRYVKGFTEHGYVIGVFCIRQFHTYQQGIIPMWTRLRRRDFYDPVFSHIGEQPVYKYQLFYNDVAGNTDNFKPFGYQEAWSDLKSTPNRVTGQMRSGGSDSLDFWHFADYYENAPTLNEQFINETPQYVDRTITVNSSVMDQFILDFYLQVQAYRVMPTYCTPGLIDHN